MKINFTCFSYFLKRVTRKCTITCVSPVILLLLFKICIYVSACTGSLLQHRRCLIIAVACRIVSCGRQRNSLVVARGLWFLDEGLNLGPLHLEHGVLATGPSGNSLMFYFCWTAPVASRFSVSLPGDPRDIKGIKEGGYHFAT